MIALYAKKRAAIGPPAFDRLVIYLISRTGTVQMSWA